MNVIYDLDFAARTACSLSEKNEMLAVVDFFAKLSEDARREGLLKLQNMLSDASMNFLPAKGFRMILEGVKRETIREVLERHILFNDLKGVELLNACIQMEGVLCIASGEHPRLVRQRLHGMLGESFLTEEKLL